MNLNLLEDNNITEEYKITLACNGLESLINKATRITNISQTCIDHAFVRINNKNKIEVTAEVIDCRITDHCLSAVWLQAGEGMPFNSAKVTQAANSYHVNHEHFDSLLAKADWSEIFEERNASKAFDKFYDIFNQSLCESKRLNRVKLCKIDRIKPWIDESTCERIKIRNMLFKRVKSEPHNEIILKYFKHYRNKLQSDIRVLKTNYYRNLFQNNKGSSKDTWKIVNEITGQKNKNSTEIALQIDSTLERDPLTVANEFNNYFISIAENLCSNMQKPNNFQSCNFKHFFTERTVNQSMFLRPVIEQDVLTVINSLKNHTTPGIDGVSTQILKKHLNRIIAVLTFIINLSFETGVFPEKLKEAVVIPIHKKSSKLISSNYRPISLLSTFFKVIEKIIKKQLVEFLEKNKFFSGNQFGFRQGLNTESALLKFMGEVSEGINNGKKVSGLFLDIMKAFDMVSHDILLQKLYRRGIRGVVYNWFKSYISKRTQRVRVNGILSESKEVKFGVPQGSVLGAILFLVYINDLCNGKFHGKVTSFADDTALCYTEETWAEIEIKMSLDLQAIQWWFTKNNMILSSAKTNYINFNLRGDIYFTNKILLKCIECICNKSVCNIKCTEVKITESIKYLGIILDKGLTWKKHIFYLKRKVTNVLRLFYFLRHMCDNDILRMLYFSFVHSRLEYGISCWGGTYITNTKSLCIAQKQFVRIILKRNRSDPSYPLFCQLKILPLRHMYVYKVLKIFYRRSRNSTDISEYRSKLRNAADVLVPRPKNTYFTMNYNFLAPRINNKLPHYIRDAVPFTIFCYKLRHWLLEAEYIDMLFHITQ